MNPFQTMYPKARLTGVLLILFLLRLSLSAQVVFRTSDVPGDPGRDAWKEWEDQSGKDPRPLTGTTGGPQRWDFSWPQAVGEVVRATSIVLPDDGGYGGSFPNAAYAERTTNESDGCQSWSYYKLVPGTGRAHYGFRDNCKSPQPEIVNAVPTVDLPEGISFGQSWQRQADWNDVLDIGIAVLDVTIYFTSQSQVDAYGTILLPGIGEVPALRLNELHSYRTWVPDLNLEIENHYFRNYFWLVPGIGIAAHVLSPASTSILPADFSSSAAISRVFQSNRYPQRRPVQNLQIERVGNGMLLSWDPNPAAAGYDIEFALRLDNSSWTPLAVSPGRTYVDTAITPPSKFYRVFFRR